MSDQKESKVKGPVVAKGKAITTLKGIMSEGDPVSEKELSGGKETFDRLVKKGYITK